MCLQFEMCFTNMNVNTVYVGAKGMATCEPPSGNDHMVCCTSTSGWSEHSHGTASRLQTFEQKAQQLLWQRRLLRIHNPVHTITLPIICILQLCNLLTIFRAFILQKAMIAGLIVVSRSQLVALTQAGAIAGPCWTVNSLSTQAS